MKKLEDQNFYELLEIPFDASPFEINCAYKEMFQLYNDSSLASYSFFSNEGRAKILSKLDEAYSTLIDQKKRYQYDQMLIERGIPEGWMGYNGDNKPLHLISGSERPRAIQNTILKIREELKTMVSSSPIIQEILTQDIIFGSDMKRIRDELGVSIEMIVEMTKIRPIFIRAIEDDQFERIPSKLLLKSFLKAYAQCLGLDPDTVARRYLKRIRD
jgi:curved DNA-binding protein CbpA